MNASVLTLTGCRVVTPTDVLEPGWVSMADGMIRAVGRGRPPAGGRVVDLAGGWLFPGFVDLHMHGGGGAQITTDDPDEIRRAVAFHRRHGTTRTLASLVTDRLDRMVAAVRTIATLIDAGEPGIAGIHLEGPFLNPAKRGSHHSEFLLPPDPDALRRLLDAGRGHIRVVTLAPELPGGMELLDQVVGAGAIVAVGHTEATYVQARDAFDGGARLATHLFNAMRQFHHRDPGPAGAALANPAVTCEIINDGVHVHDDAVRIAVDAAGPDRIAFITDATPAAGMTDGRYFLGPVPVIADGGDVRLTDGTLAGSTLTMDAAVRHAIQVVGLPVAGVARSAATTPAALLGLADRTGSLTPGKAADVVVLDDALHVRDVLTDGRPVLERLPQLNGGPAR
ncbi:N-acetylglucosamine-6-phosphate deacetylase [Actinoplanes sp. Pm04-4]|uniref:N-acetylglucosamine-6-phosphate deacetylase n=1 Tax=Paractinoplanes pyxinae TaxID=2997416 RepID=A0ABT4BCE6_9ACTN|nr:N-acetylglucosamine-6-phosphate deacetylase [Actinoplanes pyxinae]MCY1144194.1 N-acetylglucosamine-6-phosphate deacetylase [Actinoplanes pyxinae]